MLPQRLIESLVGLFLLVAIIALIILAFKVSGLTTLFPNKSYTVSAAFDDIGGLKVRSPVKVGGVQIGEVAQIALDPATFKAMVKLRIQEQYHTIPDDLHRFSIITIFIITIFITQLIYKLSNKDSDDKNSDDAKPVKVSSG